MAVNSYFWVILRFFFFPLPIQVNFPNEIYRTPFSETAEISFTCQFSLPSNPDWPFDYQLWVVLSPESQISSWCSSPLHILCGGIDWSRQSSFSWWPRAATVTRTPLISSFWVWIEFKWGEMKASVAQICCNSWHFLVYHMLTLILFDSSENYCFYFLIWQSSIHCYFFTRKKRIPPPTFLTVIPSWKKNPKLQHYDINVWI